MDWVLPTDEILANVEMKAAQEHKAAAPTPASRVKGAPDRADRSHDGVASRLRKFAFHFARGA